MISINEEFLGNVSQTKKKNLNKMITTKTNKKDKKVREEKQLEIKHTDHGAMVPEILQTSAEKKTGLDAIKETLGIK